MMDNCQLFFFWTETRVEGHAQAAPMRTLLWRAQGQIATCQFFLSFQRRVKDPAVIGSSDVLYDALNITLLYH